MYFKRYLLLTVGFTCCLILGRIVMSDSLKYIFLPWNLLLAFIPLLISQRFFSIKNKKRSKIIITLLFCTWVLFLPNAPYIITDVMHLKPRPPIPYYLDIVIVIMSAFNGLIFFFATVWQMEQWWCSTIKKVSVNYFYFIAFALCSFGIYLGRFGRFNSWHILTNPTELLQEIIKRIVFPFEHPGTWAITLLFSIMLFLFYQLVKYMSKEVVVNNTTVE